MSAMVRPFLHGMPTAWLKSQSYKVPSHDTESCVRHIIAGTVSSLNAPISVFM